MAKTWLRADATDQIVQVQIRMNHRQSLNCNLTAHTLSTVYDDGYFPVNLTMSTSDFVQWDVDSTNVPRLAFMVLADIHKLKLYPFFLPGI